MAQRALWAPWRMAYIGAPKASGCIFCSAATGDRQAGLVLAVTEHVVAMLNRYPYANAHVMLAPRVHAADLSALEPDAHGALSEGLRRSIALLQRTFSPDGMNVGLNLGAAAGAGFADHLHWHLVPRWNGDTNFMGVVGNTRVLPEDLSQTAERLRPIFERLATDAT